MLVQIFFKSLTSMSARRQPNRQRPPASRLCLEALEVRSVPTSVIVLGDLDGDRVTFKSSLGDLSGKIASIAAPDGKHSVYSVNLSEPSFSGTNFSVTVAKSKSGDGRAIVGHIDAGTNNLGVVKLAGDLGDIEAGGGSTTLPAIKSLTVDSFGRFNLRGNGNNSSYVNGDLGKLAVRHDFIDSGFQVTGNLNALSVGGSVIGGGQWTGIYATGNLGKVFIRHDLRGGKGTYSGSVGAGRDVASVTVGGSIYGGSGNNSGNIYAAHLQDGKIDQVRVGGSVFGGQGAWSGVIGGYNQSLLNLHSVSLGIVLIGEDIVGGSGDGSGYVHSHSGTLDRLTVKGSVFGGSGFLSGAIAADDGGKSILIWGGIYGGSGRYSGRVFAGAGLESLIIRGDVRGGSNEYSGTVVYLSSATKTMIIGGCVIPGTASFSGTVTG